MVSLLLEHHPNVNAADASGGTSLHFAAQNGHIRVVSLLLAYRADVNAANSSRETPLYIAAWNGQLEVVELLLVGEQRRRSTCDDEEDDVATCFNLCGREYSNCVAEHSSSGTTFPDEHTQTSRASLPSSAYVNTVDDAGMTPVIAAATSGHFDVVKAFIKAGASVNGCTADGETVLVSAARLRNAHAVSQLLELGSLLPGSPNDNRASFLSATLQTLRQYGDQTHEFQQMWMQAVDRLQHLYDDFVKDPDSSAHESLLQFAMIVFHFIRLKTLCSASSVFARLVASTKVVARLHDFRTEITFLERHVQ